MSTPPPPTFSFGSSQPLPVAGAGFPVVPSNTANAAAMALSRSIPAAPLPPYVAAPIAPQQNLQYVTYKIPAQGTIHIQVSGNYFYIDTITTTNPPLTLLELANGPLYLKTSSSSILTPINSYQIGVKYPGDFEWVEISNPTITRAVTIQLWIGNGYVEDNRVRVVQIAEVGVVSTSTITRPNNATAYAANQVVGTAVASYLTFTNLCRDSLSVTTITKAVILNNSNVTVNADFTLYLSQAFVTAATVDQTIWPMIYADFLVSSGIINFPTFVSGGAGSTAAICEIDGLNVPIQSSASSPTIYGVLVANKAYIPTALEQISVILYGQQD
jgi:hypothetical protein